MRRLIFVLTVFMGFALSLKVNAQINNAQALFIYNFSRLVEWPAEVKTGDFVIGILGRSDLEESLNAFVSNKKVGNQKVVVKTFNSVEEIAACHILFVPHGKSSQMDELKAKLSKGTLIVGEKHSLVEQGAAISFKIIDNKLKFRLKEENATRYDLKVSKSLKEMALI